MQRGYIQVYTGSGKGKTTAALGLALRAAGAGLRVFIAQFVKQQRCSEHKMLEKFGDLITVKRYGRGFILGGRPAKSDMQAARRGIEELGGIVSSGDYDMVILDEANVAVYYHLFEVDDLLRLMKTKYQGTELVVTGRYADKKVIQLADLVTEMREVKHYRGKGVRARTGIEK
jgi:cob(I)alamin adenosyltransferase